MTLQEFVLQRYWPTLKDGLCPRWQAHTEHLFRYILSDLGRLDLSTISLENLEGWNIKVRQQFKTPVTPNKCVTRLKHIFKTAVRWHLLRENPAQYLTKVKEPLRKFRPLDPAERHRLLGAACPHIYNYIYWGQYTGARLGSLSKLQEKHVDLKRNTILFEKTKNGEDYSIPLHPDLLEWCRTHFKGLPNAFVLHQYSDLYVTTRMFAKLTRRVHIKGFRFHDLRHEVGSSMAEAGAHPAVIMSMLGHKDLKMSMRYTHPQAAEVRKHMLVALFPKKVV